MHKNVFKNLFPVKGSPPWVLALLSESMIIFRKKTPRSSVEWQIRIHSQTAELVSYTRTRTHSRSPVPQTLQPRPLGPAFMNNNTPYIALAMCPLNHRSLRYYTLNGYCGRRAHDHLPPCSPQNARPHTSIKTVITAAVLFRN